MAGAAFVFDELAQLRSLSASGATVEDVNNLAQLAAQAAKSQSVL